MQTKWDYTAVANFYSKRPRYASKAIEWMLEIAHINDDSFICDIGAGTGNLTTMLANGKRVVTAVEPNNAMRSIGEKNTVEYGNVEWIDGTGEVTGLPANKYDLVTYASSFNVTNRCASLIEANRILKKDCWIACMWNHRDVEDDLQYKIDKIIKKHIPDYDKDQYGMRQEDQESIILSSGLFCNVKKEYMVFEHEFLLEDYIDSWKSHGTMHPHTRMNFEQIICDIDTLLHREGIKSVIVPYVTKIWMAQSK